MNEYLKSITLTNTLCFQLPKYAMLVCFPYNVSMRTSVWEAHDSYLCINVKTNVTNFNLNILMINYNEHIVKDQS